MLEIEPRALGVGHVRANPAGAVIEHVGEPQVGQPQRLRLRLQRVGQVGRRRDLDVGERLGEARRGLPRAMRRLELAQQGEGPVSRPAAKEAQRLFADDVVGMPGAAPSAGPG